MPPQQPTEKRTLKDAIATALQSPRLPLAPYTGPPLRTAVTETVTAPWPTGAYPSNMVELLLGDLKTGGAATSAAPGGLQQRAPFRDDVTPAERTGLEELLRDARTRWPHTSVEGGVGLDPQFRGTPTGGVSYPRGAFSASGHPESPGTIGLSPDQFDTSGNRYAEGLDNRLAALPVFAHEMSHRIDDRAFPTREASAAAVRDPRPLPPGINDDTPAARQARYDFYRTSREEERAFEMQRQMQAQLDAERAPALARLRAQIEAAAAKR